MEWALLVAGAIVLLFGMILGFFIGLFLAAVASGISERKAKEAQERRRAFLSGI